MGRGNMERYWWKRCCTREIADGRWAASTVLETEVAITGFDKLAFEFGKGMRCRKLREFVNHILWSVKQNACVGFAQHGGVVIGITRSNNTVIKRLQGQHRLALGVFLPQAVIRHSAIVIVLQAVAKQGWETQLAHQRLGEFIEGVRQNDDLKPLAQPVDKLRGTLKWRQGSNHFLNFLEPQPVLIEDF